MMQKAIERIKKMELCFDMLQEIAESNPDALKGDASVCGLLQELVLYYENGQWIQDYELDEKGLLPADLKRGVLVPIYNRKKKDEKGAKMT